MLRPFKTFTVVSSLPPRLAPLRELAHNVWWAWNLDVVELFRRLDRDLWEETGHNPVLLLGKLTQARLDEAANDEGFVSQMVRVFQAFNRYVSSHDTWFKRNHGDELDDLGLRIFRQNLVSQSACRSTLADWACSQATTSSLPAISGCLLWAWDCSTSKATLGST